MSKKETKSTKSTQSLKQPQNKKWMLYGGIGVICVCIGVIITLVIKNGQPVENSQPQTITQSTNPIVNELANNSVFDVIPENIEVILPEYKSTAELTSFDGLSVNYTPLAFSEDEYLEYLEYAKMEAQDYEVLTEGMVKNGDIVSIVFRGWLKENTALNGEEQEYNPNMTTEEPEDLTIGSGNFIDGFEDELIGAKVGSTVTFEITFPEDYDENYSGKEAIFEVDIKGIKVYADVPSDEKVKENLVPIYFEDVSQAEFSTFEEYKTWLRNDMIHYYEITNKQQLNGAILANYYAAQTINYNQDEYNAKLEEYESFILKEAEYYGVSIEEYASYYGYIDTETTTALESMAKDELANDFNIELILNALCKQENVTITKTDVLEYLQELSDTYGDSPETIFNYYYSEDSNVNNLDSLYLETLYNKAIKIVVSNTKVVETNE